MTTFWSSICLIQLLIILSTDFTDSRFCDFFTNTQKIDFGFQRTNSNEYYISIENFFWKINVIKSANGAQTLELIDNDIEVKFATQEKRYKTAFSVRFEANWITGLIDSYSDTIDWFRTGSSIKDQEYINSTEFDFQGFIPSIGFNLNSDSEEAKHLYFVEQFNDQQSDKYTRDLRYFLVEEHLKSIGEVSLPDNRTTIKETIEDLSSDWNLVSIFSYKTNQTDTNGLILMIQERQQIKYCILEIKQSEVSCNSSQLEKLVDCPVISATSRTTLNGKVTTSFSTRSGSSKTVTNQSKSEAMSLKTILLIVFFISIPVIILLIAILVYIIYRNKIRTTNASKSQSSKSKNDLSHVKNHKIEVKTIFKKDNWESEIESYPNN